MPVKREQKQTECSPPQQRGRVEQRKIVAGFRAGRSSGAVSQRQYAVANDIPRTTLQHWLRSTPAQGIDAETAAFFETPAGVMLLHRLLLAAHLALCWMGSGGIRLVCLFVTIAGLGPFIANSYGAQHGIAADIQAALVEFGAAERTRLAAEMPARDITLCEDETFLKEGICLVAIEPVSGFVVLEEFAERRDAETWKAAIDQAIEGMPVKVVQIASDEAKALIRHAVDVGAHHSPDLFHVQHEICQAVSLPLHNQQIRAEEEVRNATEALDHRKQERDAYLAGPRGAGRPRDVDGRVQAAESRLAAVKAASASAATAGFAWRAHMRGIGDAYHPYDLATGTRQSPELLSEKLNTAFTGLRDIVRSAGLPEQAMAGIEKAARVVPKMISTVRFYEARVEKRLEQLDLAPDHENRLRKVLIPAAYLESAARRRAPDERGAIEEVARRLRSGAPPSSSVEVEVQLHRIAALCAEEFQRSSSCVEGRNGRLSQYQHALRQLNPAKQAALTVVHNYLTTRPDGTTAAERFFGSPPKDLIAHLLAHVSVPARPARPRPRRQNVPRLQAAN
jgi:hypothetical protein